MPQIIPIFAYKRFLFTLFLLSLAFADANGDDTLETQTATDNLMAIDQEPNASDTPTHFGYVPKTANTSATATGMANMHLPFAHFDWIRLPKNPVNTLTTSNDAQLSTNPESQADDADLSAIEASPHELALTQVLSEICPALIDHDHQDKLIHSYHAHLKLLMPTVNPQLAMPKLNQNPNYLEILQGVREWTLGYPADENKALCIEFADAI